MNTVKYGKFAFPFDNLILSAGLPGLGPAPGFREICKRPTWFSFLCSQQITMVMPTRAKTASVRNRTSRTILSEHAELT